METTEGVVQGVRYSGEVVPGYNGITATAKPNNTTKQISRVRLTIQVIQARGPYRLRPTEMGPERERPAT